MVCLDGENLVDAFVVFIMKKTNNCISDCFVKANMVLSFSKIVSPHYFYKITGEVVHPSVQEGAKNARRKSVGTRTRRPGK